MERLIGESKKSRIAAIVEKVANTVHALQEDFDQDKEDKNSIQLDNARIALIDGVDKAENLAKILKSDVAKKMQVEDVNLWRQLTTKLVSRRDVVLKHVVSEVEVPEHMLNDAK